MTTLDFPHGSTLTVLRAKEQQPYNHLGDVADVEESHTIGPCSIVDQAGNFDYAANGTAEWIGTVDVHAPPETDVKATDKIRLPNGDTAIVIKPPKRPVNPFTGWAPFVQFTLAAPGYTNAYEPDYD